MSAPRSYSVVGLGKLGASMAAAIASRGFPVIGVDINRQAVDALGEGRAPVAETGLEALVQANRERLRATTNHREAVLGSDLTFVIVPTPSDESGAFSLQYAAWAFGEIGEALRDKIGYHLVVLTSTVLPGATRHGLLPILERRSGKRCGADFGLCYSPEFIALGSVIRDFLHPDFTLVGEVDDRSGRTLECAYAAIMPDGPPCKRMSLENAELAKVSVNAYVTTKITFANMLADLCERIPGGDVDVVSDALGQDARIGRRYLTGALGFGGPCFPRDNVALAYLARALGTRAELPEATDRVNRSLASTVLERVGLSVRHGTTVAVLGLAYKPSSHVIEESQGIVLAKALSRHGARVVAHDPLASSMAAHELKDHGLVLGSLEDCLAQAAVVVVTTPDPAYAALSAADFRRDGGSVTVVDCWRLLAAALDGAPGITYLPIGRSVDDRANAARLSRLWADGTAGRRWP
ncbi:MAG: UDP-glucose/GDP-mannose dehydrogenase family protein [Acidobacteria bacterium]|nr:UDP-glucose/GDP-mannose dehydrogenase family protein [Acidobacteriota bacterium]